MNNKMRRSDRQLNDLTAWNLLEQGEYGILATTDAQGQPYGTPLNYVTMEHKLYFHCAPEGLKLRNLSDNPKVCFTVIGHTKLLPEKFSTEYESVMVFGTARKVTDNQEKTAALRQLVHKYSHDFIPQGYAYIERALSEVAVVCIENIEFTGKARKSQAYSSPKTMCANANERKDKTNAGNGVS